MRRAGLPLSFFVRRFLQYRRAAPSSPDGTIGSTLPARVGEVIRYLTFHQELLRDRRAGIDHLLVFYGFFILFIGTCLVFLEHDTPLHFFYGRFYFISSLIVDLGGLAFIAGLLMFLGRRMGQRSGRILREWWVTSMVWLLLAIGVSGFLLEGARIAFEMPQFEKWSVAGYAVAAAMQFAGVEGVHTLGLHRFFWTTHAIFCVVFFALLPWKFFGHMVYGAVSWATRALCRLGTSTMWGGPSVVPKLGLHETDQFQGGVLCKVAKVLVSGHQRNLMIDARLCNQAIGEASPPPQ